MGRAVSLREDFDGETLRRLAKGSKDAGQSRRLLALAEICDGGRRRDAQRQALARIVESGPIPAIHGVVRCRRNLCSAKGDQDSFAARVETDWQPGNPDPGRGVSGHRAEPPKARGIAAMAAHVGEDR